MTTQPQQRPSEKLANHQYLIKCSIERGGFSQERIVTFPCYDSKNRLGVDYMPCHPSHLDEENQLCRADLLKKQGDKALINMNGETFKVHIDSLVDNS